MNTLLTKNSHGGDFYTWTKHTDKNKEDILDFSVNVRPTGMPHFIKNSLLRAINELQYYPSQKAEELQELLAKNYGLFPENFVLGNGSNELFLAIARALKNSYNTAYIFEPAFSEYQLALEKENYTIFHCISPLPPLLEEKDLVNEINSATIYSSKIQQELENIQNEIIKKILEIPNHCLIFIANPANPSGLYLKSELLYNTIQKKPDNIFIIDEAFIEYTGEKSLIYSLPQNAIIVRSATKFYAVAGLRLGYVATNAKLAQQIQKTLPSWNINSLAIECGKKIFSYDSEILEDCTKEQKTNRERLYFLYKTLSNIKEIQLYASWSNYVLFKSEKDIWQILFEKYNITIRNCQNYHGLENEFYYRICVHTEENCNKLLHALTEIFAKKNHAKQQKKKPALMLLGTSSNAGKSILTSAFCRIFTQDGYTVRPFKAQNMSLNSGVTAHGEEMGRAQIVQAMACKTDPKASMNPILLKPQTDMGSQIIVLGKAIGTAKAREYYKKKNELWQHVTKAYDELASEADIMVLEGAGSPAEINLKENDIVNLKMAKYANASTLLVGDIDRGGIYASFLGTWQTLNLEENALLSGYLVNRFRGDSSLLAPAHRFMEEITGKKVLGVIPYIWDLNIPEEDMAGSIWANKIQSKPKSCDTSPHRDLEIAIIQLAKISNHTDFEPLGLEKQCYVYSVRTVQEFGTPDIVIIPGSKSVVEDLAKIQENGLAEKIIEFAKSGGFVFGICGGLQILGEEILDPYNIESTKTTTKALGLLPLSSTFNKEKCLTTVENIKSPLGETVFGYEIHHGKTIALTADFDAYFSDNTNIYGYAKKSIWATYIHGVFDDDVFRLAFLNYIRKQKGLAPMQSQNPYDIEKALDRLADIVRQSVDIKAIYKSMGL